MGNWQIVDGASTFNLETDLGFRVMQQLGTGMAPISNISSDFGLLDGGLFQRQRADVREFTLVGVISGSSVADLHIERRNLINRIKPDRSTSQEAITLRYLGAASTLQASAYYAGGLELGNVTNKIENQIAFRFVQYDPYWEKITSSSAALTVQSTVANANYIVQRAACGAWGAMGTGMNDAVNDIVEAPDGTIFAGGDFSTAGGATACRVAQWSGTAWSKVGNAMDGSVTSLALGANGTTLYAAGSFTGASGLAANRVAQWSGTAWATMGTGMNGLVRDIIVHSSGSVVAGGDFTTADGNSACRMARWSGASWSDMASGMKGTAGTENVRRIITLANGNIAAGGIFTQIGVGSASIAASNIAQWSGSSWETMGAINSLVLGLVVSPGGNVYAANNTDKDIRRWTGSSWQTVGLALNATINSMAVDKFDNNIFIIGSFTRLYNVPTDGIVKLLGESTFIFSDVNLPSTATVHAAHSGSTGVFTIGYTTSGTASAAGVTAITNSGGAATYPILTACAPTSSSTRLNQLVNYTTKEAIYFDLALQPSEIVTLDLRPGKKTLTSNIRGNIINTVFPGSNLATWKLLPGTNNVSFWLTGGSGAAALSWVERFWSCDG